MASLLKSFGKGCLYILVLPILIVILAFYIVIGIGMFIYVGIKAAILFFTGRNFGELPEDIKAKAILEGPKAEPTVEEPKVEEVKHEDIASHYYMPLDSNIPFPKDNEEVEHKEETPAEGGNE